MRKKTVKKSGKGAPNDKPVPPTPKGQAPKGSKKGGK
jgi:hypothetical protein